MKNKVLFIAILIVLVTAVAVLKLRTTSFSKKDQISALSNSENITRLMFSTSSATFDFEKIDQTWVVNGGEAIDKKKIDDLLKLLGLVEIHSPVSESKTDEYHPLFETNSKTVTAFQGNKQVYSIQIIAHQQKDLALTKGQKVFFLNLKGHNHVSLYNAIPETANDFFDNVLINLSAEQVSAVQIDYPNTPENGFTIMYHDQSAALFDYAKKEVSNFNTNALTDYKLFFSGIRYEQIDTLVYTPNLNEHLFRLKLATTIEKIWHIDGFVLQNKTTGKPNTNEFAAVVNNKIMVKLNYADFDPVLLDLEYFLKK